MIIAELARSRHAPFFPPADIESRWGRASLALSLCPSEAEAEGQRGVWGSPQCAALRPAHKGLGMAGSFLQWQRILLTFVASSTPRRHAIVE